MHILLYSASVATAPASLTANLECDGAKVFIQEQICIFDKICSCYLILGTIFDINNICSVWNAGGVMLLVYFGHAEMAEILY